MPIRITRHATAQWSGDVPTGQGTLSVGSGAFEGPYSLKARIEDTPQTNPEELIGAGHAGCFTMSLSNLLSEEGHPPESLETVADVRLEEGDGGFSITHIALRTHGTVAGVDADQFAQLAERAKATCPVSRALAGVEISLEATLDA